MMTTKREQRFTRNKSYRGNKIFGQQNKSRQHMKQILSLRNKSRLQRRKKIGLQT
jgi:hypothetical protein